MQIIRMTGLAWKLLFLTLTRPYRQRHWLLGCSTDCWIMARGYPVSEQCRRQSIDANLNCNRFMEMFVSRPGMLNQMNCDHRSGGRIGSVFMNWCGELIN